MFVTDSPFFEHFWYPVMPIDQLEQGPQSFTLLDQPLVLWLDEQGNPCAAQDRCSHRSAKLSCGEVVDGTIRCPYHGWGFTGTGECVHLPQQPVKKITKIHHISGYAAQERYGYVWVALREPLKEIPVFEEDEDPAFRRIPCFYETWETSAFRSMENELDMAHFSFVHRGTFGDNQNPIPKALDVRDLDAFHLQLESTLSTLAPPEQAENTKMPEGESERTMKITWYMPFTVKLEIGYASGLRHLVINNSTPISKDRIQVVQFHFRDDTEAQVPAEQLIAFETRIVQEDRAILEIVDPDVDLYDFKGESHMNTDRAGLLMRRKFAEALDRYNA